jgi:hypothetical protein
MPGAPLRPGALQHDRAVLVDVQVRIVDPRGHVVVVLEYDRASLMLVKALLHCGRLDDRAARGEIAAQHRKAVLGNERVRARADHFGVMHDGAGDVFRDRLAVALPGACVDEIAELREECAQAARVVEILHQEGAGRAQVREHRRSARNLVEPVDRQVDAAALRHCDEVHDRVGRTAQAHDRGDGVVERGGAQVIERLHVLPDHFDDRLADESRHLRVARVGRRDRGRAGKRQAERLDRTGHRARRPHRHAMARRARNSILDLLPVLLGDVAGAQLRPVFPRVRAAAENLPL